MSSTLQRRALLALSLAAAAALTACGSSSVESALEPDRFLVVGDGFSDIGQGPNGTAPTVNDGSRLWTQELANYYGKTVTAANTGGYSYAQAYARVSQADTTGHNAPSITDQVTKLLAATTIGANDVVLMSAGMSDVYAEVEAAGGVITDATRANVSAAGTAYGKQVRRLLDAGATHVAMTGVYNLGNSPWGKAFGEDTAKEITKLAVRFNDAALIEVTDLWQKVLWRDSALMYNVVYNDPETYALNDKITAVCTVPDVYNCTTSTLVAGADSQKFLWADGIHMTPRINRMFGSRDYGESMASQLKERW